MQRKIILKISPKVLTGVLCVGITWMAIAQGNKFSNGIFNTIIGTESKPVVKSGVGKVGRSAAKSNRIKKRITHKQNSNIAKSANYHSSLHQKVYTPARFIVVDPNHQKLKNVKLSWSVYNNGGSKITGLHRPTDAQGIVDFSKIGPLPSIINVYTVDKDKWKLKGEKYASFEISRESIAQLPDMRQVANNEPAVHHPIVLASLQWPSGLQLAQTVQAQSGLVQNWIMLAPVKSTLKITKLPSDVSISSPAFAPPTPWQETKEGRPIIDVDKLPQLPAPAADVVEADIPTDYLEDGPVPIVVSRDLPGGTTEGVIDSYSTTEEENEVAAPPLRLASLKMVKLGNTPVKQVQDYPDVSKKLYVSTAEVLGVDRKDYLGVLSSDDQIKEHKKELGKQRKEKMDDGSQWWIYEKAGIAFKMRKMVSLDNVDKTVNTAERVRLTNAEGGSVGGISVGDTRDDVISKIGDPQITNDQSRIPSDDLNAKGDIDTYIDSGLRICYVGGKVAWIDLTRPTKLLLRGTTAFAPRGPARLYVAGFQASRNSHSSINDINDFKQFLRQLPSVIVVDSAEEADLAIVARVGFTDAEGDKLLGIIPQKYEATTTLTYSLYDENTGQYIAKDKTVSGTAKVDITKDIIAGGVGSLIARKFLGNLAGVLGLGATYQHSRKKIQNAANIIPPTSVRQAFNSLTQDISQAVDFNARVTHIDYERGLMTLNVGSDLDVHPSTPNSPFEFRVEVGGMPLGEQNAKDGRHADYYDAVVRSVTPTHCVCEFQHVEGVLRGNDGVIPNKPDKNMLSKLPDPTTGLISAQATVNFPPVNVITDGDMARLDAEMERQKAAQPQEQTQEGQQEQSKSKGFLDNLLGGLLQ